MVDVSKTNSLYAKVKRKRGNIYANLTLIVFCGVILSYGKLCNLIIFFAKWHVLA